MVAEVIVNIGGKDLLEYSVPENFKGNLAGRRVMVPLGKRKVEGLVYRLKDTSDLPNLKGIIALLDPAPVISRELLDLHHYLSDYYLTPLMRVAELSFPASVKARKKKVIKLEISPEQVALLSGDEKLIIERIAKSKNPWQYFKARPQLFSLFEQMLEAGFLSIEDNFVLPQIRAKAGSKSPGKKASDQGLISIKLTREQEEAIEKIKESPKPVLLFGVTGSGKTEIYIEMIKETLKEGKSALYMVPEISLISQTKRRIEERLDIKIVDWHSKMSLAEKNASWQEIQKGQPLLVLGARSSIFAPLKNPALIIVDEEHETSYKQNEPDPRYNAINTALKRAELSGSKIILGSATPDLERFYRAQSGQMDIVSLKSRPDDARLPVVEVVDLKEEFKKGNRSVFSRSLEEAIRKNLAKKEQIILFLNRRGFSRFILCRECGHVINCPDCSVPMVMHRGPDLLKCHYCDKTAHIPRECPECSSRFIRDMGMGTQKIEELLLDIFPQARITRLDQDQVKARGSYDELLGEFSRRESDILLGTQMVVKGLDFSNVTLVGIISADLSLNIPDIYSAERTFQLLTQVAGRAGRGQLPGKVVIQTYNPEHFAIKCAREHDYLSFYRQEIKERKLMDYPPFTSLVRVLISGENQKKTEAYAEKLAGIFKGILKDEVLLGPGQAPINKINKRYRFHFIIKTKDNSLHNYLKENYNKLKQEGDKEGIRILFDRDPFLIL